MILTTRTFTRPSVDVPWHFDVITGVPEFVDRMRKDFIETGKIVTRFVNDYQTDTICEVNIIWDSQESMDAHFNDPDNVKFFSDRDVYNESVGITNEFKVEQA